jgi:asparagine synthase (glutamine-hydrolysing)
MPGLTLFIGRDRADSVTDLTRTRNLLLHDSEYRSHSIADMPGVYLGWTGYDEYPVRTFSSEQWLIYFEGRVYNRPFNAVEEELKVLARDAMAKNDDAVIEKFILDNEGSYVVAIIEPQTRQAAIFSDPFGRLPLYFSSSESRLVVGREAKFVHLLQPSPTFDRIGCAQVLAFGLPLGDRTVFSDVRCFPDAGLLRLNARGQFETRVRRLYSWNLDEELREPGVTQSAVEFASLFRTSCRNWGTHPDSKGNIVSLSGGHDSRAVATGLSPLETNLVTITYRDPRGTREDEIRYARQVAERLGAEWQCIDLQKPAESAYEELAWLKDGMNWSSMGYILSYLRTIVDRWGRGWTYMSGDGGDDCLKVTAPHVSLANLSDCVGHVLRKETSTRPERAEAILKLPAGVLHDELHGLLKSYPEQDFARRVKHFKVFERGRRCYFEGEDRTRFFLWQDSPFYSLPLFRRCMLVPDTQKDRNHFCREALLALSPRTAAVPISPLGLAPSSWKYVLYHRLRETPLGPPLVKAVRRISGKSTKRSYVLPPDRLAYLKDQLNRNTPLSVLMDAKEANAALGDVNESSFLYFWTVVMLEKAHRERLR